MVVLTRLLVDVAPGQDASAVVTALRDRLEHTAGVVSVDAPTVTGENAVTAELVVECGDSPERQRFIEFLRDRNDAFAQLPGDVLAHRFIENAAGDAFDLGRVTGIIVGPA